MARENLVLMTSLVEKINAFRTESETLSAWFHHIFSPTSDKATTFKETSEFRQEMLDILSALKFAGSHLTFPSLALGWTSGCRGLSWDTYAYWVKWLRMQGHRLPSTLEVTNLNPGPDKINLNKNWIKHQWDSWL